jgi:hypothetical protein
VPLDLTTPSSIGSIFLTDEIEGVAGAGQEGGEPCFVEWPDWQKRPNPVYGIAHSLTYAATIEVIRIGRKGRMTLVIPSCPKELFLLLRQDKNAGGSFDATLYHPSEPGSEGGVPVEANVEYLAVEAEDEAWETGEPQSVTIRLYNHGSIGDP